MAAKCSKQMKVRLTKSWARSEKMSVTVSAGKSTKGNLRRQNWSRAHVVFICAYEANTGRATIDFQELSCPNLSRTTRTNLHFKKYEQDKHMLINSTKMISCSRFRPWYSSPFMTFICAQRETLRLYRRGLTIFVLIFCDYNWKHSRFIFTFTALVNFLTNITYNRIYLIAFEEVKLYKFVVNSVFITFL